MSRRALSVSIGAALTMAVLWKAATAGAQAADIDDVYCALCHFEQGDEFVESIHYQQGMLLCNDCHGGDPFEADVEAAGAYARVADRLLFDARAPAAHPGALPGGNALAFDWRLLAGHDWPKPWLLAGGLDAGNVAEAVRISGARAVDVSSGVEDRPGHKNPASIAEFLTAAAAL